MAIETVRFDPRLDAIHVQQEWDAVADEWGHLWEYVDRAAQRSNDRLVELARVKAGHRVLDLATGIGEPAVTAARRVGPAGWVLGVDIAPRMLDAGRQRATDLGLCNIEFRAGDARALTLPEGAFDAVLSRWAIMLFADLPDFFRHVHHLLAPGGWFAGGLWGPPERVPLIAVAFGAASQVLHLPPLAPGEPSPFWTGGVDHLEEMLRTAGFAEVSSESVATDFEFPSVEFYARFVMTLAGPLKSMLQEQPAELQQEVAEAIVAAGEAFAAGDGTVRMRNETLCVSARKPA